MAVDVFNYYNGIVNDDAAHQNKRKQGNFIQRTVQEPHNDHGHQEGERDANHGENGVAQPHEKKDEDTNQTDTNEQIHSQGGNGIVYVDALVLGQYRFHFFLFQ